MPNHAPSQPARYRSIWISDVYLGSPECRADYLLAFLHSVQCEHLYLVGDIIDIHSMKRKPYWPQSHNDVLRTILGKAKHGTRIVYVPGNHDDLLREYDGMKFGNVRIQNKALDVNANGQRFLVLHGDEFDSINESIRMDVPPLDAYSFPSGHTLHAVSFTITASAYYPELAVVLAPFAFLVALSRLVLGLHYPTDVLAGAVLGLLIAHVLLFV